MAIPPSRNVGDSGHTTDHNSITAELTSQAAAIAGKSDTGHTHAASDIASGVVAPARLGTGSSITTKFLRGDGTWQTVTADTITHTHDASAIVSGQFGTGLLGSGAADTSTFLRGDGTWAVPTGTASSTPGSPSILVAAANSPSAVKARADYVCSTTNAAATINAAIVAANNQIAGGSSGVKYGSVVLADGVYTLSGPILIPGRGFTLSGQGQGTVLMKASSFTDAGRGATAALIKMANTTSGDRAPHITIKDMFLLCRNFGTNGVGSASGSVCAGIWLEQNGPNNTRTDFGPPYPIDDGDNSSHITGVVVRDCSTGIYWTSTDGFRGMKVLDTEVLEFDDNGFYINASDSVVMGCVAATSSTTNGKGFNINGGNSLLCMNKAFYVTGTGGVGFYIGSSRASVTACEAQDNRVGFSVAGANAKVSSCRVDNQVVSMDTGFDLQSATHFVVGNCYIQTRNSGSYSRGLNLPDNTTSGMVDVYIDPTQGGGITKPLSKGSGYTEITSSSNLPTGLHATVMVRGVGAYVRSLAV